MNRSSFAYLIAREEELKDCAKKLLETGRPVFDSKKGMINPIKLNITDDTKEQLKNRKGLQNGN